MVSVRLRAALLLEERDVKMVDGSLRRTPSFTGDLLSAPLALGTSSSICSVCHVQTTTRSAARASCWSRQSMQQTTSFRLALNHRASHRREAERLAAAGAIKQNLDGALAQDQNGMAQQPEFDAGGPIDMDAQDHVSS